MTLTLLILIYFIGQYILLMCTVTHLSLFLKLGYAKYTGVQWIPLKETALGQPKVVFLSDWSSYPITGSHEVKNNLAE